MHAWSVLRKIGLRQLFAQTISVFAYQGSFNRAYPYSSLPSNTSHGLTHQWSLQSHILPDTLPNFWALFNVHGTHGTDENLSDHFLVQGCKDGFRPKQQYEISNTLVNCAILRLLPFVALELSLQHASYLGHNVSLDQSNTVATCSMPQITRCCFCLRLNTP
jgi:hypothetical protein